MFMGSHSFGLSAFVSHFSSCLGSDETSVPVLASGKSPWVALKQSVKGLSVEFSLLSEKAAEQVTAPHAPHEPLARCFAGAEFIYLKQGRREEDNVVEKLNLFLDLLQSYKVSVL